VAPVAPSRRGDPLAGYRRVVIDFGDVPAWVEAVATVGALVGAGVTAWFAVEAFRAQSAQVELQRTQLDDQVAFNREQTTVLALQADEMRQAAADRQRAADGRRRAQAAQVFLWTERKQDPATPDAAPRVLHVHVKNSSSQPVYELELQWHDGSAPWGDPDRHPHPLMPGEQADWSRPKTGSGVISGLDAVAVFTDAAGARWRRHSDHGELDELSGSANQRSGGGSLTP
jgi:hypothetical protein